MRELCIMPNSAHNAQGRAAKFLYILYKNAEKIEKIAQKGRFY